MEVFALMTLWHISCKHIYLMGGVNHSGIGKSHGYFGFKEFSNERAVLKSYIKGGITWPFQFPYTKLKKNILEILIKYF